MIVKFIVPGEPVGKGRPRFAAKYKPQSKGPAKKPRKKPGKEKNVSVMVYTPKRTADYEELVKAEYTAQTGGYYFEGACHLAIRAYFAIPKSASKAKREAMIDGRIRPAKTPDIDNLIKSIADALNEVAYRDDRQVVSVACSKYYGSDPRAEVYLWDVSSREREIQ